MKTTKLLKKVRIYIDSDRKRKQDRIDCIKVLLKKLKHKHRSLKGKLAREKDAKKKKKLHKECNVLWAQRNKGVKTLKKLLKS